jgi:hypothetical protein
MAEEETLAQRMQSWSHEEIAAWVISQTGGATAQGQAEATRRLVIALEDFRASADRWSRVNALLALAVVGLTIALVVIAVT